MLHILNTLEREFSKRFIESLNFGIENIENEYFLRVLEVNKSDDCDDCPLGDFSGGLLL